MQLHPDPKPGSLPRRSSVLGRTARRTSWLGASRRHAPGRRDGRTWRSQAFFAQPLRAHPPRLRPRPQPGQGLRGSSCWVPAGALARFGSARLRAFFPGISPSAAAISAADLGNSVPRLSLKYSGFRGTRAARRAGRRDRVTGRAELLRTLRVPGSSELPRRGRPRVIWGLPGDVTILEAGPPPSPPPLATAVPGARAAMSKGRRTQPVGARRGPAADPPRRRPAAGGAGLRAGETLLGPKITSLKKGVGEKGRLENLQTPEVETAAVDGGWEWRDAEFS